MSITVQPIENGNQEALINLCRIMHDEAPSYRDYRFQPEKVEGWANLCLSSEDWHCLIAWNDEGEAIGFVAVGAVEMLFSSLKTVDDLGFFVLPEYRGSSAALRLMRSLEPWAKSKGVAIRMGITTQTNLDQAAKFFKRFGFEQTGILLTKKFT